MTDVRLPNGNIIRGVPEGTSKEEIQQKAIAAGLAKEGDFPTAFDEAVGIGEAGLSVLSSVFAEPVSGLAGIAAALFPGGRSGAEAVEATRGALTYQPKTQEGQGAVQTMGDVLAPVGEAFSAVEQTLGDTVLEKTGSPALAAAAHTAPTLVMELLGFAGGKGAVKASAKLDDMGLTRTVAEAAPSSQDLRRVSGNIFKEIDNMGATVEPNAYNGLVAQVGRDMRKAGYNPKYGRETVPKANAAISAMEDAIGETVSLEDLDSLRAMAKSAASDTLNATESSLGMLVRDSIDDFLDSAENIVKSADDADIGPRLRVARNLWGRARKSELIDEAFSNADLAASGFENGIRNEFTRLLKNKKTKKLFSAAEAAEMRKVINGERGANIARLLSKMDFVQGRKSGFIGGSIGAAAGYGAAGTTGMVVVPVIGHVSGELAKRLTANNARLADSVIRAGRDARKITRAYLDNVPKAERSIDHLSQILMRPDIYLGDLDIPDDFVRQAAQKTAERRAALMAASVAGASAPNQEQ